MTHDPMLQTLLDLLAYDLPCPEIMLEEDGDICLEWEEPAWKSLISINPTGGVNWAVTEPREHGSNLDRLKAILHEREAL